MKAFVIIDMNNSAYKTTAEELMANLKQIAADYTDRFGEYEFVVDIIPRGSREREFQMVCTGSILDGSDCKVDRSPDGQKPEDASPTPTGVFDVAAPLCEKYMPAKDGKADVGIKR